MALLMKRVEHHKSVNGINLARRIRPGERGREDSGQSEMASARTSYTRPAESQDEFTTRPRQPPEQSRNGTRTTKKAPNEKDFTTMTSRDRG